jgi:hypothetical protein
VKIELDLTEEERRYLAMHARYESERAHDPRAGIPVADRDSHEHRWREIADALHSDPWGKRS